MDGSRYSNQQVEFLQIEPTLPLRTQDIAGQQEQGPMALLAQHAALSARFLQEATAHAADEGLAGDPPEGGNAPEDDNVHVLAVASVPVTSGALTAAPARAVSQAADPSPSHPSPSDSKPSAQ